LLLPLSLVQVILTLIFIIKFNTLK
jgi:hypothetical protein